jgi:uncharacterized RDD family membrane protein YckC
MNMTLETVTLLRRSGAIIYDTVLAGFSIVIVASIPFLLYAKATGNELPDVLKILIYFAMAYGFFTWFWTHGGQTLGMRAWKIRVVGEDGLPINQQQASLRFFWSILSWGTLGIGFLVSLTQAERLAWHDQFSRTRLIRVR